MKINEIPSKLPSAYLPERVKNIVRFMIIGGIGTFVQTWFFLLAMMPLDQPDKGTALYYVAFVIGFILEMIPNYLMTNWYTFGTRPTMKNAVGFMLARAVNLFMQLLFLPLAVKWFSSLEDGIISMVVIFVAGIVNFLIQYIFFKDSNNTK